MYFSIKLYVLVILVVAKFSTIESNAYSNYTVGLALQTSTSYNGPINMGINTV